MLCYTDDDSLCASEKVGSCWDHCVFSQSWICKLFWVWLVSDNDWLASFQLPFLHRWEQILLQRPQLTAKLGPICTKPPEFFLHVGCQTMHFRVSGMKFGLLFASQPWLEIQGKEPPLPSTVPSTPSSTHSSASTTTAVKWRNRVLILGTPTHAPILTITYATYIHVHTFGHCLYITAIESGYHAHIIVILCTLLIRCMLSSCQNLSRPSIRSSWLWTTLSLIASPSILKKITCVCGCHLSFHSHLTSSS